MRIGLILVFYILVLCKSSVKAQDIDAYCGEYVDVSRPCKIAFTLALDGIKNLTINGKTDTTVKTYDIEGYFGSSLLLNVNYYTSDTSREYIHVLLCSFKGKFIIASGFFLKLKRSIVDEDVDDVMDKFSFSLEQKRKMDF